MNFAFMIKNLGIIFTKHKDMTLITTSFVNNFNMVIENENKNIYIILIKLFK